MDPNGKGVTETQENFASTWIDHGLASENASYQYVINPTSSAATVSRSK